VYAPINASMSCSKAVASDMGESEKLSSCLHVSLLAPCYRRQGASLRLMVVPLDMLRDFNPTMIPSHDSHWHEGASAGISG